MKIAFITGADRGLGLGFVKVLLERGYKVYAGQFFDESTDLKLLKSCYASQLYLVRLDISSEDSVRKASEQIKEQTEYIDLLINNAGILGDMDKSIMDELDFEDILHIIDTNALGPIRVINAMVEQVLKSDTKTIVNVSSEAGSVAQNWRESWFGYCMSKSALNMGAALIHKKIMQQGGRVIQIHPGWVKSYMQGYLNEEAEYEPEDAARRIVKVVEEQIKLPITEIPNFVDLNGNKMQW